jgi:hypothetical protein
MPSWPSPLVDFMDFVLFMSTLGANLIWTITLYSNRVFRRDPAPETVPPSEMRCKEGEGAR